MPNTLQPYHRNIIMRAGESGWQYIRTLPDGYQFLTIYNPTTNQIEIYPDIRTDRNNNDMLKLIPVNTAITIPISGEDFSVYFSNGGGAEDKKCDLTFTVDNLNQNGALGSTTNANVTIGADSVGLAKEGQFPAALTPAGGVKVGIVDSLPTGGNTIGKVDVLSMPAVSTVDESSMTQPPETNQLSIGVVQVPLRSGGADLAGRRQVVIANLDAAVSVFVGKSGVTSATGFPIPAGGTLVFPINPSFSVTLYAIAASGSVNVAVMEVK